ncbi:MAG: hypothetical protein ACTSP6_09725 [Promethearchaeota archaeon]
MSALTDELREKMMYILKDEEEKTDLDNLSVLSRVGMKVASSTSSELDADSISASSTALIDLGVRLVGVTAHGVLKEIILHNESGYSILMAINDEYIVFGGLKGVYRIGYYLGYLQELVKKLAILISGGEISEISLTLQEDELQKTQKQQEEEAAKAEKIVLPSAEQDKEALSNLLGVLDEWDQEEKEAMGIEDFEDLESNNIVSIPDSMVVSIPKDGETFPIPSQVIQDVSSQDMKNIKTKPDFKIYKDEVPPIPLEDYTPMDVEESDAQETELIEPPSQVETEVSEPEDFESEYDGSEYDTRFVLDEESEALDSVLKDLGWEEEE